MFNKKSSKKKKGPSLVFYIISFISLISIPFIYKIFLTKHIKKYSPNILNINIPQEYKSKLYEIYSLLFNKYYLQILIPLLIVYNYCNIYKTFILIISLQFPMIISQILNLLLIKDIKEEKYANDELLYGMGYPLFLWHLIFNSDYNTDKMYNSSSNRSIDKVQKSNGNNNKNILGLISIIIFILLEYFVNYVLFNDLDKIIFDAIIGLVSYLILFYLFKIETNSPKQFKKIIEFKLIHYFLIFLFFNLFFIIFCIQIINDNEDKIDIIKKYIFKYSLTSIVIGIILGSKYEYNYYFEKKINIWAQYNFESDYEISSEEEEESLTSIISSNNKRQWNNTTFCLSLIRLIFLLGITFACLYSFLFINFDYFILDLFLKYIFPVNLFSFGLFYWYKLILKYLKVTNIFLLTSFRESF